MRTLTRLTPTWVILTSLIVVAMLALGGFVGTGTRLQAFAQDASPATTPCPPGDAAANEALGRAYFDAFAVADAETLATLLAPDYVHHWGFVDDTEGAETTIAGIEAFVAAHDDLEFTVEDVIATTDEVVVRWILSGSQTGTIAGVSPTGVPDEWTGINIFWVECGQLVEGWGQADHFGRLRRTGVITDEELGTAATPEA